MPNNEEELVFIPSTKIQLYPTANRGKYKASGQEVDKDSIFNPESRLFTEENNTRVFDKLADYDEGSFVITKDPTSETFEFVLNGYYFVINLPFNKTGEDCIANYITAKGLSINVPVYACIQIITRASDDPHNILFKGRTLISYNSNATLDEEDEEATEEDEKYFFVGLTFKNQPEAGEYALEVWDGTKIPTSSKLKFDKDSVFGGIDDGEDKSLSDVLVTTKIKPKTITNQPKGEGEFEELNIEAQNNKLKLKSVGNNAKIEIDSEGDLDIASNSDIKVESRYTGKVLLKAGSGTEMDLDNTQGIKVKTQGKPIEFKTGEDNVRGYSLPGDEDGNNDWEHDHTVASREWVNNLLNTDQTFEGNKTLVAKEAEANFQLLHQIEDQDYNIINVQSYDGSASGVSDHSGHIQVGQPDLTFNTEHFGDISVKNSDNEEKILLDTDGYVSGKGLYVRYIDNIDDDDQTAGIAFCSKMHKIVDPDPIGTVNTGFRMNGTAFWKGARFGSESLNSRDISVYLSTLGLALRGITSKFDPDDSTDTSIIKLIANIDNTNPGRINARQLSIKDWSTLTTYKLKEKPLTAPATIEVMVSGELEPMTYTGNIPSGRYVFTDPGEVRVTPSDIEVTWSSCSSAPSGADMLRLTYLIHFDYATNNHKQSLIFSQSAGGYPIAAISYNTEGNISYGMYAREQTELSAVFGSQKVSLATIITGSTNIKNGMIDYRPTSNFELKDLIKIGNTGYSVQNDVFVGNPMVFVSDGKYNAYKITPTGGQSTSPDITSSDKNVKNSITAISEDYEKVFDNLKPVTYKFNLSSYSGRTHIGFVAQDVKKAIEKAGLTTKDVAAYCEFTEPFVDGSTCGLRYEEFIALNTHEIQKLKKEIKALKAEINKLKK